MTPEEKAKELYNKFWRLTSLIALPPDSGDAAKEAAIICVDEILKTLDHGAFEGMKEVQHFQSVKEAINKI